MSTRTVNLKRCERNRHPLLFKPSQRALGLGLRRDEDNALRNKPHHAEDRERDTGAHDGLEDANTRLDDLVEQAGQQLSDSLDPSTEIVPCLCCPLMVGIFSLFPLWFPFPIPANAWMLIFHFDTVAQTERLLQKVALPSNR